MDVREQEHWDYEFNAQFDHKLGMYSAPDPIQEMAYDNDCSREEMLAWINRDRSDEYPVPLDEPMEDDGVPF
jgi:hypothetical protein